MGMPQIYDVTEENRELVLEAANKTCLNIKVIKACVVDESVWIIFENLLDSSPEVKDILPRALSIMQAAQQEFYKNMS